MVINIIQGDLIDLFKNGEFDIIAHQCNCVGHMGAGIAKALAQEFPQIDLEVNGVGQAVKLFGTYEYFKTEHGHIINIYSQFSTGQCTQIGIDSFSVRTGALISCLKQINKNNKGLKIGLPLIGSGLAADRILKENKTDLEYFQTYIQYHVNMWLGDMDVTIVYL